VPKNKTVNTTLLRLKDKPFGNATELKNEEKRILREEWESIERARVRRLLLLKEENKEIVSPFLKGFQAKFVGKDESENVVKVYLTKEDQVQIEVDSEMKDSGTGEAIEGLVKSLSESFMNGYLTALGLKDDSLFKTASKKVSRKS
jgi:hypothetical protein